jgi:hypothetical protein
MLTIDLFKFGSFKIKPLRDQELDLKNKDMEQRSHEKSKEQKLCSLFIVPSFVIEQISSHIK